MVRAASLLAVAAALAVPAVQAHGSMSAPKPSFADIYNKNAPSALSPGTPGPYTGSDEIKTLAEKAGSKCGKTDANGAVQPIPADGIVAFDISAQHIGPCELWFDEKKVVSAKECWKEFPSRQIKVDFSSCKSGGCLLRWVWMATHTSPWEFFDNCVRVGGGSGSNTPTKPSPGAPSNTTAPSASRAPEPAPKPTEPMSGTVKPAENDYKPSGGETKPSGSCVKGKGGDKSLDAWCQANCAMGFCPEAQCEPCA